MRACFLYYYLLNSQELAPSGPFLLAPAPHYQGQGHKTLGYDMKFMGFGMVAASSNGLAPLALISMELEVQDYTTVK